MHKKLKQTGRVTRPSESSVEFEIQEDGEVRRGEDAVSRIFERIQKIPEPLTELSGKLDLLIRRVSGEQQRVSELEEHDRATDARLTELEGALERTLDRLEDLEPGRLFSRDIRIVGLKEGTEGPKAVRFLETWVPDVLGMRVRNNRIELERARRTGAQKRADGKPRAVLVRFYNYSDKRAVLKAARDRDTVRVMGRKVTFRDFSFAGQKKRAFKPSLLYPAQINVLHPPRGGGDVNLHPFKVEASLQAGTEA